MVMKPLLVESAVAMPTLGPLGGGVTLALVVGQTCPAQGSERAAGMVAVKSGLRVDEL